MEQEREARKNIDNLLEQAGWWGRGEIVGRTFGRSCRTCAVVAAVLLMLLVGVPWSRDFGTSHGGPKPVLEFPPLVNSLGIRLQLLYPGKVRMGSTRVIDASVKRYGIRPFWCEPSWEYPVRMEELKDAFYVSAYEITQEQYEKIMGVNPSRRKGNDMPVEMVSREDAAAFCRRLTKADRFREWLPESLEYRLPTEAEWEYACRTSDRSLILESAWCYENSDGVHHPVGQKTKNVRGIYDMRGNVSEWCRDAVGDGGGHVIRGGGFGFSAALCLPFLRHQVPATDCWPDIGFRIVCAWVSGKGPGGAASIDRLTDFAREKKRKARSSPGGGAAASAPVSPGGAKAEMEARMKAAAEAKAKANRLPPEIEKLELVSRGKRVVTETSKKGSADSIVDGDPKTFWTSADVRSESITIDLGEPVLVKGLLVHWNEDPLSCQVEFAYTLDGKQYRSPLSYSKNYLRGRDGSKPYVGKAYSRGVLGRYVPVLMKSRHQRQVFSVSEIEVRGVLIDRDWHKFPYRAPAVQLDNVQSLLQAGKYEKAITEANRRLGTRECAGIERELQRVADDAQGVLLVLQACKDALVRLRGKTLLLDCGYGNQRCTIGPLKDDYPNAFSFIDKLGRDVGSSITALKPGSIVRILEDNPSMSSAKGAAALAAYFQYVSKDTHMADEYREKAKGARGAAHD